MNWIDFQGYLFDVSCFVIFLGAGYMLGYMHCHKDHKRMMRELMHVRRVADLEDRN